MGWNPKRWAKGIQQSPFDTSQITAINFAAMKTLILILAICMVSIGATVQTQQKTWEYKFLYECNEKKANSLGQEGWELTAIQSTGTGLGNNVPTYVFKRLK
jgi:hypothetical protein